MSCICRLVLWMVLAWTATSGWSQSTATVSESVQEIPTYPFSDPNPIPILASNPKIYPYHTFDGYAHDAVPQGWTVITLENDYLIVYILPQIGGKVWGAVDKVNGHEFIYRNEVIKFRNIAMRGPWTSGGIEFNFGIIGHHPSTATPVDYTTRTNADGSVSCIVGNMDLPSQTRWRVEVRLPADRAYFETRVLFANESEVPQAYYNWMTAAAQTAEDLRFYTPGNQYLEHGGKNHPWPIDAVGRDLSRYRDNHFGGSKSYHVVGAYEDFFGGYYEDRGYGFGHWAEYEEMPGQKLWLWALSRQGAIWEDLLTDEDGQYIEFQAGRMLDQYSLNAAANPITKSSFEPGRTDIWREFWFPIPTLGGLSEVSKGGIMHVVDSAEGSEVMVASFGKIQAPICIRSKSGDTLLTETVSWDPLQPQKYMVDLPSNQILVEVPRLQLQHDSRDKKEIARPFEMDSSWQGKLRFSLDYKSRMADQQLQDRNYSVAKSMHLKVLEVDPVHIGSRLGLAQIAYRSGDYAEAWSQIEIVLQLDTYHEEANYWAGIIHRAQGHVLDALESFGWGARSLSWRAECYAQMAELYLAQSDLSAARKYGNNALDFNRFHLGARATLVLVAEASGDQRERARQISILLSLDPLSHFAHYEKYLLTEDPKDLRDFKTRHQSEFKYQSYLELAVQYFKRGRADRAKEVLALAPEHPLVDLWRAFLLKADDSGISQSLLQQAAASPPDFVFPYRLQSGPVLLWAIDQHPHWKFKYFRSLQLWSWDRKEEARTLMTEAAEEATSATFFLAQAALRNGHDSTRILDDLNKAHRLDTSQWRVLHEMQKYIGRDRLELTRHAFEKHPGNDVLTFDYVEALLANDQFPEAIEVLTQARILPFEGAGKGHDLWVSAQLQHGLTLLHEGEFEAAQQAIDAARRWPENLGVGRPFDPDETLIALAQMAVNRHKGIDLKGSADALVLKSRADQLSDQAQLIALVACMVDPDCSSVNLTHSSFPIGEHYAELLAQDTNPSAAEVIQLISEKGLLVSDLLRLIIKHLLP